MEYQNWGRYRKKLKNRKLKQIDLGCKIECCNKKKYKIMKKKWIN